MKNFKGKRCKFLNYQFDGLILEGKKGTIVYDENNDVGELSMDRRVLVEFDENIGGHDGNASGYKGKNGHCWWVRLGDLEVVQNKYRRL